jgi:hypothetical protein
VAQGLEPPSHRTDETPGIDDPLQRQVLLDQLDRVAEEKRLALLDPGPSWHDWFFWSASRWWIGLGFLILDSWILVAGIDAGNILLAVPSIAVAIYLEFLVYRYLWYSPAPGRRRRRGPFRPSWITPVPYGRWTPEAAAARLDPESAEADDGPRPEEFL